MKYLIICLAMISILPVMASQITLDTDKSMYIQGDMVSITGNAGQSAGQLVAIEAKDANSQSILLRTVQTDSSGNFMLQFKIPQSASLPINIIATSTIDGAMSTTSKQINLGQASSTTPKSGCLIATAAFGSELAPQVQQLRETRDNIVLKTGSGAAFMTGFNSFYYTFAPTVADWERENPVFKESVKATITPLITTLSILNYIPIHSDGEMLFYGIGVILLNIGIYFVAPIFGVVKIKNYIRNRK